MDYARLASEFQEQGYLVLPGFFEPALMDRHIARIVAHFGSSPPFLHDAEFLDKSATEVIPWFPQREGVTAFDAAQNDTRLLALTRALLGADWVSHYCMVMYSRHGTRGQAWHQDCPPDDPQRFNLNRLVYAMDIPPGDGGQIVLVPGSHRLGVLPAADVDYDFSRALTLRPEKGMLVLIHGHCWHRVTPVTGKFRISTNYRCGPAGTTEDITDVCVYRNMRYRFSTSRVIEDRPAAAAPPGGRKSGGIGDPS